RSWGNRVQVSPPGLVGKARHGPAASDQWNPNLGRSAPSSSSRLAAAALRPWPSAVGRPLLRLVSDRRTGAPRRPESIIDRSGGRWRIAATCLLGRRSRSGIHQGIVGPDRARAPRTGSAPSELTASHLL